MSASLHIYDEAYCAISGQIAYVIFDVGEGVVVINGNGKLLIKDVLLNGELINYIKLVKSSHNRFVNI